MRLWLAFILGISLLGQAPSRFRLPNGLEVVLVERHDRPLLRAELRTTWPEPNAPLPADLALLSRLFDKPGSNGLGAVEEARAEFHFRPGARALNWTIVAPSSEQESALGLLAQQVFRPALDPARVEQVRRSFRAEYREASPELLARDRFLGLLGLPTPLLGEVEQALDRLGFERILHLHQTLVRPDLSRLVLVGDLSRDQARQLALLHFGTWSARGALEARQSGAPLPKMVVCPQSARGLELWVAFVGRSNAGGGLETLARGLERQWNKPPAPFEAFSMVADGTEGIVVVRFVAPLRTGSVAALTGLQQALADLREKGLPAPLWKRVQEEAVAERRVESLHPGAWSRRLASEGGEGAFGREAPLLNAELARILEPGQLRYLVLGAEPDARPSLEDAGFKPLLWVNR